jgi:hypothetical protein
MRTIDQVVTREMTTHTYEDLAEHVYGTVHPTRAQLSAISRAVGRLQAQGRVKRHLTGYVDPDSYSWDVRRETLVFSPAWHAKQAALRGLPEGVDYMPSGSRWDR